MKSFAPKPAALGLALALLIGSGIAGAQTPTPQPTPQADSPAHSAHDAAPGDPVEPPHGATWTALRAAWRNSRANLAMGTRTSDASSAAWSASR